eukprot:TRINITY_DN15995_c0_g2_i1.p2 TRINITY_DN15995_c0_g2~~TRINITY_DN15995_c0_g2_i1.p2  ORF type:complete len:400 (+),score=77.06 TRINITY_DN15995_c0_g2_i1:150-1349(+)
MTSSVFWKWNSALKLGTIQFEGHVIRVKELKEKIAKQGNMTSTDFDLTIKNSQTGEEYSDDRAEIPKNTSLTVWRKAAAVKRSSMGAKAAQGQLSGPLELIHDPAVVLVPDAMTEDERLSALVEHSSNYFTEVRPKQPGQFLSKQTAGRPPPHYICRRCRQPGHFITNCPTAITQPGRRPLGLSFGIPSDHIEKVDEKDKDKANIILANGQYGIFRPREHEFNKVVPRRPVLPEIDSATIPAQLKCGLCQGLLFEASMLKCCRHSFCYECLNGHLEEHNWSCPRCQKKISDDFIFPDQSLRRAVEDFKSANSSMKPPMKITPRLSHNKPAASEPAVGKKDEQGLPLFDEPPKPTSAPPVLAADEIQSWQAQQRKALGAADHHHLRPAEEPPSKRPRHAP